MSKTEPLTVHDLEQRLAAKLENHARLAPARAAGGPDNSAVTERGIRGLFYDAIELASFTSWARQCGLYMPSDTRTEKHRWLGQVPEPRKHFGGIQAKPVRDFSLDIVNEDFEIVVQFSLHDRLWDQISHIARRTAELGIAWADHWNKLCTDLLEDNPTAYDGVALFSGSHTIGDSGTLDNDLAAGDIPSLNVSNTSRPTKAEAAAIMADLAAYLYTMKDDVGRPANQAARDFMVLCPPRMLPGFRNAISDDLYITGGSNELRNLGQNFTVVAEPRLAALNELYMFRTDGLSSKPLILQEAKAPTMQVIGPDSEHAAKNDEVLYITKAVRAVAPGEFRHVIRATLS